MWNYLGFSAPKEKHRRNTFAWYLDKHTLKADDISECPICFIEFDELDIVVGLACSIKHVYHKECIT